MKVYKCAGVALAQACLYSVSPATNDRMKNIKISTLKYFNILVHQNNIKVVSEETFSVETFLSKV